VSPRQERRGQPLACRHVDAGILVGVVLLIAVLAAVGAATALVVRRRLSHLDALERLLASATIASGILIAVHLVPLMLGLLARGSVLAAAALAVALAALVRPSTPIAADERIELPPSGRPQRAIAAAGAGFAASAALADLGRWGGDEILGVDSLTFHLPNVGRWIQSATLWQLDQFCRSSPTPTTPTTVRSCCSRRSCRGTTTSSSARRSRCACSSPGSLSAPARCAERHAHRARGGVVARRALSGLAELRHEDRQRGRVRGRDPAQRLHRPR